MQSPGFVCEVWHAKSHVALKKPSREKSAGRQHDDERIKRKGRLRFRHCYEIFSTWTLKLIYSDFAN